MLCRTIAALVALASIANGSLFAQQHAPCKVGDSVVIEMTGDLAVEYAKRVGSFKENTSGLQISTTAIVAQRHNDGRFRIEHTSHIIRDGRSARLVTLTATVDSTRFVTDVTPVGTAVYSSPADQLNGIKPVLTTRETSALRLQLSDLKGLKLCTWTLAEEIGN
jgi:hypothetical protein